MRYLFLVSLLAPALAFAAPICPSNQVAVVVCGAQVAASEPTPIPPPPAPNPTPAPVPAPSPTSPPSPVAGLLFSEDFEAGLSRFNGPDTTTAAARVVDACPAGRPGKCLKVSQTEFNWGGELEASFPATDQAYLEMLWYVPASAQMYELGRPGSQHLFRLAGKCCRSGFQLDHEVTGAGGMQSALFWSRENATNRNVLTAFPRERWFRFGVFVKLGTVGGTDGEIRYFVDGVETFKVAGKVLRDSSEKLASLRLVSNYDDANATWYFDEVRIYATMP